MALPDQYILFNKWYQTLGWILDRCEQMPRKSRFTIANRVADHALDIMELIVGAIYSPRDIRRQKLKAINRRLEALRILFRLCFDRRFISDKQYVFISEQVDEAGRMVGGWLKSL